MIITNWLPWPIVLAALVAAVVIGAAWLVFRENARVKRARQSFTDGREPLSDEGFLRLIAADPGQAAMCLGVRRGMGLMTGLPPELLYPDDELRGMSVLYMDNAELPDFRFFIEKATGARLSWRLFETAFVEAGAMGATLGRLAAALGRVMESRG